MVSLCPTLSPAPLHLAARTVPPMATPVHMELMIKLIMDALLIAASPVLPTTFPTTSMSMML